MKKNKEFGEYLDRYRGSTTIQRLADIYGCTKVYMWDILRGNVNPPQDFVRVDKIVRELELNKEQRDILFNKTALSNDIPIDIKKIIVENPKLINKIRNMNEKGEI